MRSIFIVIFAIISFTASAQVVAPEILRDAAQKTQSGISDPSSRPLTDYPYFYNQISRTLFKYNFLQNRWVAQGAVGTNIMANLTYTPSPANGTVANTNGSGFVIPLASPTAAGLLSPSEKALIGVHTNLGTVANPTNNVITNSNGTSTTLLPVDATNAGLITPPQYAAAMLPTNLDTIRDATKVEITNSRGTGIHIDSTNATKAGLFLPYEKAKLQRLNELQDGSGTTVTVTGTGVQKTDWTGTLDQDAIIDANSKDVSIENAENAKFKGNVTQIKGNNELQLESDALITSKYLEQNTKTDFDGLIMQNGNELYRIDKSDVLNIIASNTNTTNTLISVGNQITSTVNGSVATTTLPNETALNTPSTAIIASGTSIAVPSTNVQGAISDLATAVKTATVSTVTMANPSGNQINTTVNGITSNTITLANETAANTPFTPIIADATHIANGANNTQAAIDNMSIDAKKTMHKNTAGTAWDAATLPIASLPSGGGALTDIARKDASGNLVYGTVGALGVELGLARPNGEIVYGTGTGITSVSAFNYTNNKVNIGSAGIGLLNITSGQPNKIQLGVPGGDFFFTANDPFLSSNLFWNGGSWQYSGSRGATFLSCIPSQFEVFLLPSQPAGTTIGGSMDANTMAFSCNMNAFRVGKPLKLETLVNAPFLKTDISGFVVPTTIATTANLTGAGTTAMPLDLANTGIAAGTYNTPTLTIDAKGRVTSAATPTNITITGVMTAQSYVTTSDSTTKTKIKQIKTGLDILSKINPIQYQYKNTYTDSAKTVYYGFSAQNIAKALPEIVLNGRVSNRDSVARYNKSKAETDAKIERIRGERRNEWEKKNKVKPKIPRKQIGEDSLMVEPPPQFVDDTDSQPNVIKLRDELKKSESLLKGDVKLQLRDVAQSVAAITVVAIKELNEQLKSQQNKITDLENRILLIEKAIKK